MLGCKAAISPIEEISLKKREKNPWMMQASEACGKT